MAEEDDDSQKTEDPTERRLEEAFKKGQVAYSREITNFLILLVCTVSISWFSPFIMRHASINVTGFIEHSHQIDIDDGNVGRLIASSLVKNFLLVLLPIAIVILITIFSSFLQNQGRFVFSEDAFMPQLDRISPMAGFKRIFSARSFVEFGKSVVKILVVGVVCYISVRSKLPIMRTLHELSISGLLSLMLDMTVDMLIGVCIVMAVVAALDFLYQRHEFTQKMRMTKHDLKEEYKQTEGSPEIKAKLRSMRMERARKRMMAAVPKADVIITNPEHFSIALQYDVTTMRAPMLIAKGQDQVALKIREVAKEHNIPIIENPPLARSLYASVDVDEEIPVEHYKAVAEIIGYVYKLKNKLL